MTARKINWNVYGLALLFTLIIFLSGLLIGRAITYARADSLEISQKAISALFDLANLKGEIYNQTDYCNLSWDDVWKEKVEIGMILTRLESQLGKNNERVIELKKLYQDVEIKTLNLVKVSNERCGYNYTLIVFFYSNKKGENYTLSEIQGAVLDTLYNSHKDNLKVFSFDIDQETNLTKLLKDNYNITLAPTLIINDQAYPRFVSKNEISQIIK